MKTILEYLSSTGNITLTSTKVNDAFIVFYKYRGEKYVSISVEWLHDNIKSFRYYIYTNLISNSTSNLGDDIVDCIEDNPAAEYIEIRVDNRRRSLEIIPNPKGNYSKLVERIPEGATIIDAADTMSGESRNNLCQNMIDRLGANMMCSYIS